MIITGEFVSVDFKGSAWRVWVNHFELNSGSPPRDTLEKCGRNNLATTWQEGFGFSKP